MDLLTDFLSVCLSVCLSIFLSASIHRPILLAIRSINHHYELLFLKLKYLTPLDEYISSGSNEISGIKARFKFRGHKLSLGSQLMTILNCAHWIVLEIHDNTFIFLSHSSRQGERSKQMKWTNKRFEI